MFFYVVDLFARRPFVEYLIYAFEYITELD